MNADNHEYFAEVRVTRFKVAAEVDPVPFTE